jgi:hypothetical protein
MMVFFNREIGVLYDSVADPDQVGSGFEENQVE